MIQIKPCAYLITQSAEQLWGEEQDQLWFNWHINTDLKRITQATSVDAAFAAIRALQAAGLAIYIIYDRENNPVIEALFSADEHTAAQVPDTTIDLNTLFPANLNACDRWEVYQELSEPDYPYLALWYRLCDHVDHTLEAIALPAIEGFEQAYQQGLQQWAAQLAPIKKNTLVAERTLTAEEFICRGDDSATKHWYFEHRLLPGTGFTLDYNQQQWLAIPKGILITMPTLRVNDSVSKTADTTANNSAFWHSWLQHFNVASTAIAAGSAADADTQAPTTPTKLAQLRAWQKRWQSWIASRHPLWPYSGGGLLSAGLLIAFLNLPTLHSQVAKGVNALPPDSHYFDSDTGLTRSMQQAPTHYRFLAQDTIRTTSAAEQQAFAQAIDAVVLATQAVDISAQAATCDPATHCQSRLQLAVTSGRWMATSALYCKYSQALAPKAWRRQMALLDKLYSRAQPLLLDDTLKAILDDLQALKQAAWQDQRADLSVFCEAVDDVLYYFNALPARQN
ncbi:MAG: hypothetical protein KTR20_07455 [Cellvibrionaceae bacterium]|nr:hypothetical protein [Cellvibrionaceae bacterium]